MYCTIDDIEKLIPADDLIALTDDEGLGSVNQDRVNEAIDRADALIDGYCAAVYTVPFAAPPKMVILLSADIAAYYLYCRRDQGKAGVSEIRQKRYDNALKFLSDVSRGVISLGAQAPEAPAAEFPENTKSAGDRIFTDGSLGNY